MQSAKDKAFNLELSTIARLLCLTPYKRRAVKLDDPIPIYRIEDRATNEILSFVLFQPVNKPIEQIKACPVKIATAKHCAKIATEYRKPWFILYNWTDSHFGLLKGLGFYEIESNWTLAPKNSDIAIPGAQQLILLYHYDNSHQTKVQALQ